MNDQQQQDFQRLEPLARRICARMVSRSRARASRLAPEDAYTTALIGLWRAVATHDATRGSLAGWVRVKVCSAVGDWLRQQDLISCVPRDACPAYAPLADEHVLEDDPGAVLVDDRQPSLAALEAAEALAGLPYRERLLLELRYGSGMTHGEVGAALGVSASRACQLHGQALRRLRS